MNVTVFEPDSKEVAELEILIENAPLVVAGVWGWEEKRRVNGLYLIYIKHQNHYAIPISPFYASIDLASKDMRRILKAFPKGFWGQPLGWCWEKGGLKAWVEANIGKPDELIGGVWATK